MKKFKQILYLFFALVLFIPFSYGQTIEAYLEGTRPCEEELSVALYLSASPLNQGSFSIGSSTLFLNYEGGSISFKEYIPEEFDGTYSSQAALANWENQAFDYNDEYGLFQLVLHKNEGGSNNYIFDVDLPAVKIGTLVFENVYPGNNYKIAVNRLFTSFTNVLDEAEIEEIFLDQTPPLEFTFDQNLFVEDFDDLEDSLRVDEGMTAWSVDLSATDPEAENYQVGTIADGFVFWSTIGEAVWRSEWIELCDFEPVHIAVDVKEVGTLETDDYVRVYYEAMDQEEQFIGGFVDDMTADNTFETIRTTEPVLENNFRIVIRVKNGIGGDFERHIIDNIRIELFDCEPGTPCNDRDECTIDDRWQADCSCQGTLASDEDNDGICDLSDDCPGFDNSLIGTPCNDGDDCTVNDRWTANCTCEGTTGLTNIEDFEQDWGIWQSGGTNSVRVETPAVSSSGSYSINLIGNGNTSIMTTSNQDFSGLELIIFGFSYYAIGYENGEDFWLQVSTDGGNSFITVADWRNGEDFENNQFYSAEVTLAGPFGVQTQFRLRADASDDSDNIFIDDVRFESCLSERCTTVSNESFEENLGIWNQLGAAATLSTDPAFATSGANSILIVNEGGESYLGTEVLDLSDIVAVELEFSYLASNFEEAENFLLQSSTDGGNSFTTIQQWIVGTDFRNNIVERTMVQIVGPFSSNTLLRFKNNASTGLDYLYLDDITLTACKPELENQAPVAAFNLNPGIGVTPLIITFDAAPSSDPNGDELAYHWDFGDGNSGYGQRVTHTYPTNGFFTATLTVSDGQFFNEANRQIIVNPAVDGCNSINSETFETDWGIWSPGDAASRVNNSVYASSGDFSALLVNDGGQTVITTHSLDLSNHSSLRVEFSYLTTSFEEGEDFWLQLSTDGGRSYEDIRIWTVEEDFINNFRFGASVAVPGPFSRTTKLRFRGDATADTDFLYLDDIIITACENVGSNQAPIANFIVNPPMGNAPLAITLDASTSADLDGDPLSYYWDFGDGQTGQGQTIDHVYLTNGTYTATLTVSDGRATDRVQQVIVVAPQLSQCLSVDSETFEDDLGIWELGVNAHRLYNSYYASSGKHSILLQGNGEEASLTTTTLGIEDADLLDITFNYVSRSLEEGEELWLQISQDGGDTYETVEDWTLGIDFDNGALQQAMTTIPGPFSTTVRIRLRSETSANTDYIYIDNIALTTCDIQRLEDIEGPQVPAVVETMEQIGMHRIYPNPASQDLIVDFEKPQSGELVLYTLQGQELATYQIDEILTKTINLTPLPEGAYLIKLIGAEGIIDTKRFVKIEL